MITHEGTRSVEAYWHADVDFNPTTEDGVICILQIFSPVRMNISELIEGPSACTSCMQVFSVFPRLQWRSDDGFLHEK